MRSIRLTGVGVLIVVLVTLLGACGGSDSGGTDSAERDLPYFLLDGTPGRFIVAEPGLTSYIGPCAAIPDPFPSERGARLLRILRDRASAAPYRDCAEMILSAAEFSSILAFVQPDYFVNRTLIGIYLWNQGLEFHKVQRVRESETQVELALEVCSQNSTNTSAAANSSIAWIAIPRTDKSIVVLPLRVADTSPFYPGQIGRCVT